MKKKTRIVGGFIARTQMNHEGGNLTEELLQRTIDSLAVDMGAYRERVKVVSPEDHRKVKERAEAENISTDNAYWQLWTEGKVGAWFYA